MRRLRAAALGLLHGPAELLPVSSSAHVALLHREPDRALEISLHAGSAVALVVGLRRDAGEVLRRLTGRRVTMHLLAGAIPAVAGWTLRRRLTARQAPLAGLLAGSAALVLADRRGGDRERWDAGAVDGLVLGVAQAVALVPGVSRSGATIAAARWRGFAPGEAWRLSREVGLPVTAGAVAVGGRGGSPAGLAAAFAATLAALPVLRAVERLPLWPWAAYRCLLALALVARSRR